MADSRHTARRFTKKGCHERAISSPQHHRIVFNESGVLPLAFPPQRIGRARTARGVQGAPGPPSAQRQRSAIPLRHDKGRAAFAARPGVSGDHSSAFTAPQRRNAGQGEERRTEGEDSPFGARRGEAALLRGHGLGGLRLARLRLGRFRFARFRLVRLRFARFRLIGSRVKRPCTSPCR